MNGNWSHFLGAAALTAYFLIAGGAPPLAVAAGLCGAAALVAGRRWRARKRTR